MRSTCKVLFYLKRNAPKKNGLVPVMCRITVNGKIAQFSCKLDVAKHIIEKYDGMAEGDKLLPVPCYANCKNSIKVIAKKCGIEKTLRGT